MNGAKLLLAFLLTRLTLIALGILSITYLPMITGDEYRHVDAGPALDMWYRWDAGFYTSIALYGYQWSTFHKPSADMAFFPLYPMLIRGLNRATGCAQVRCALLNGLLISNLALLASVYMLFEVVRTHKGDAVAYRSVGLLLLSPISIFLSGCYTESLFLCLTLVVFLALQKKHFGIAVMVATAASLTRLVGAALYLPLLYDLWQSSRPRRMLWAGLSAVPLIAIAVYIAYMGKTVGDWTAYFSANAHIWGRSAGKRPWEIFTGYFTEEVSLWGWRRSWIDLFFALFYLLLAIATFARDRAAGAFALLGIGIPLLSGTLVSMPRYGGVLFPFYQTVAEWADRKWKRVLVYGVSFLLLALFTARFVTWHWIA